MAGANLQVHVGADTEGFLGEMRRMDQQFAQVTRGVNEHGFALNKAQRALETFAAEATGTNRTLGILTTVVADFTGGTVAATAALLAIGATAWVYDKLTEGARKAREEQEKLTKALATQFLPKTGPRSTTNQEFEAALHERADLTKRMGLLQNASNDIEVAKNFAGAGLAVPTLTRDKAIAALQTQLDAANQAITDAYMGSISTMTTVTVSARNLSAMAKTAQDDLIRYNEFMKASYGRIGGYNEAPRGPLASRHAIEDAGAAAQDLYLKGQALSMSIFKDSTPQLSMPNISINDGLTKEQIKQREKLGVLIDDSNKNANNLHDAIWGAAAASANLIVGALNIGGGGKGSQLGGALGGTAGFALGYVFGGGPVGGAVGSTIGNIIGSAIGGLFDHHKKSIDKNTQALTALTAALELNTPSGYKVAPARYGASDPAGSGDTYDTVADAARQRRTRGGAQPLMLVGV